MDIIHTYITYTCIDAFHEAHGRHLNSGDIVLQVRRNVGGVWAYHDMAGNTCTCSMCICVCVVFRMYLFCMHVSCIHMYMVVLRIIFVHMHMCSKCGVTWGGYATTTTQHYVMHVYVYVCITFKGLSRGRQFDSGQNSTNPELKFAFQHMELQAKQLDYFLRSYNSNINQLFISFTNISHYTLCCRESVLRRSQAAAW